MASTVTKIVDPDNGAGTDYTSLSAWEAQNLNLTALDQIQVAKCRCSSGSADTTAVNISGWTTDATRYIKVWTDPSESYRHTGKWSSTKYRITGNASGYSRPITITCDYVYVDGIQVYTSGNSGVGDISGIAASGTRTYLYITNCIVVNQATTSGAKTGMPVGSNSRSYIFVINCVVYDFATGISLPNSSALELNGIAYNCTVHNSATYGYAGFYTAYPPVCKNCIADGCGDGFYRIKSTVSTNNASSIAADAPGANARDSQTFSFVDPDNGDFHLASNDAGALSYGLNLYNDGVYAFQTDIDGQDRGGSGATWDIGADEYVVLSISISVADSFGISESLD